MSAPPTCPVRSDNSALSCCSVSNTGKATTATPMSRTTAATATSGFFNTLPVYRIRAELNQPQMG